jgi:hypothetical protein
MRLMSSIGSALDSVTDSSPPQNRYTALNIDRHGLAAPLSLRMSRLRRWRARSRRFSSRYMYCLLGNFHVGVQPDLELACVEILQCGLS